TAPTDPLTNPLQAQTWGLGRVAALEHPHHWAGLIDLPETLTEHTSHHLCAILTNPNHEDQLAIRNNGAHARRLTPTPPNQPATPTWQPHGTILITGGTGALGRHIARWLATHGADHL